MTFEIVTKNVGLQLDKMQVSVTKHGFSFGSGIIKHFGESNFVEVYLDTTRRKVGFKSAENNITGFKLKKGLRSGQLTNPLTTKRLEFDIYEAKIEDGFVVINVSRILKKGQEKQNE